MKKDLQSNSRLSSHAMGQRPLSQQPPFSVPGAAVRPSINPANQALSQASQAAMEAKPLPNGFEPKYSQLLHDAGNFAKLECFDGKGCILMRGSGMEAILRRGGIDGSPAWAVLAIPIYDMNQDGSVEVCLHFLAELHSMVHVVDYQFQVGIDMTTEKLEILLQLPVEGISPMDLGKIISGFMNTLQASIQEELQGLMKSLGAETE